ncbi:MAG TPA: TGS domain-containing protein, partial [Pyrinomonadaceae bacterium]
MSEISVQLGGGRSAQVPAGATVAEAIKAADRDAAKQALAAKVNGREVDLSARLGESAAGGEPVRVEPVLPGTLEGLDVIRHSTAHLLAAAVLDLFPGTKLGVGPALLEDPRYGFFYDIIAPRQLTEEDLPVIEKRMRELAKRNLAYRREELSKAEALLVFDERGEPLKCELIVEKA